MFVGFFGANLFAYLRNFHRSFESEVACYSSNFGNKLQLMVGKGKEYRFTSNFDILWLFISRKTELRCKMAKSPQIAERPLVSQSRGREQQTHSGDEIGWVQGFYGREFHVRLQSTMYLPLEDKFYTIVIFRNGIYLSVASKS